MSSKFVPNFELNQGSSLRRPGIFPLLRGKQRRGAPMQAIPLVLEGEILMNPSYRWFAKIAFFCALLSFVGPKAQAQTYVFGTASYSAPDVSANSPLAPRYGRFQP
jgi:hypothetical protein